MQKKLLSYIYCPLLSCTAEEAAAEMVYASEEQLD